MFGIGMGKGIEESIGRRIGEIRTEDDWRRSII
jgi:hypothetical protein